MEEKYFTIALNKRINRQNAFEVSAFKFITRKLRVFNSEFLYVKLKSGIIACQDSYYGERLTKMPIIVKETADGYIDAYTDYANLTEKPIKLEIIEPIRIYEEVPEEEVKERFKSMEMDNLSKYSYPQAVKEYRRIIDEYKEYCTILTNSESLNDSSFTRKRS